MVVCSHKLVFRKWRQRTVIFIQHELSNFPAMIRCEFESTAREGAAQHYVPLFVALVDELHIENIGVVFRR